MPQVAQPTLSLLAGTAIVLVLAACGGSDEESGSAAPGAKEAPPKTAVLAVNETQPSKDRYAFEGLKAVPAGPVKVEFTTRARDEHELQLVRIDGNHSEAEVRKILLADDAAVPDWLHAAGGVTNVRSGTGRTTTQVLPPGRYFAADDEPHGEPVPSAAERGAFAAFEVTGEAQNAELPQATATVTATDTSDHKHAFEVSGLKTGKNTLLFKNESREELHHIVAFPLLPGRTAQDAKRFLETQGKPSGPPPVDFENGDSTAVLDQGTEMVTTLNLRKAGDYVLICFLPDRDGKGKPHFEEGMLKQISVR